MSPFVKGLPYERRRDSKSKLGYYEGCPRKFWYKHIAQYPEESNENQDDFEFSGERGTRLHSYEEQFLKALIYDRALRASLFWMAEDGVDAIADYFNKFNTRSPLIQNLSRWHQFRWRYIVKTQPASKWFHYFAPIQAHKLIFVEQKIYSPFVDATSLADSWFWIPPKVKGDPDEILVHDLKSSVNKKNKATWRRKELWFQKYVLDSIPKIFPNNKITCGAITYIGESQIKNMSLFVRFTRRQENATKRLIQRYHESYENDDWPCKPTDWCHWCPFIYVCDQNVIDVLDFLGD